MFKENINELLKRNSVSLYMADKVLDLICNDVKSFIFVATTGRSGSNSLTKLFSLIEGVSSFHEPFPIMYNDYPLDKDKNKYFEKIFRIKKIRIKKAAAGHNNYFESNHQFIKTFIDEAISCFGDKTKVIHLIREPYKVARSFYQINSIPGKTDRGKLWLLDPMSRENQIQISDLLYDSELFKHDLYKCLWYWYEVEARIKIFKKKYPNITFFKIEADEINNPEKVQMMFNALKVSADAQKVVQFQEIRENLKLSKKVNNIEVEECIEMNNKLFKEINNRYGIEAEIDN